MKMRLLLPLIALSFAANAKTFQNSYVSFEVPDDWTCMQEGVAWTCTPLSAQSSKEAVIVLASKVAGPEDNLNNFRAFLNQPKRIVTKVGTPMPSKVMYAQERMLAGTKWIQAQHLGSEIQDYYTLYLATVKEQLAILVSFSAEHDRYQTYNPVFDRAMKTLKIVANQQLLFPKKKDLGTGSVNDPIGIQASGATPPAPINVEDMLPPPEKKRSSGSGGLLGGVLLLAMAGAGYFIYLKQRKKKVTKPSSRPKSKSRPRE